MTSLPIFGALRGSAPALVAGIALAFSGASTYWDIATHVDGGRERFLTPPHIALYSGVTIALAVVSLAMLADRFGSGATLRQAVLHPFRGVRAGLAAAGTGLAIALAAAPLDNAWHEIYGLDITIWSPPHLLAIFGISGSILGLAMLVAPVSGHHRPWLHHFLLSSFLAGLVISTGEFEFNGPQYRIAFHPIILSAAATLVFVAASRGPARWSATRVALFFEAGRLVSLFYLVALGHSLPFVPFLIPVAIAVDVVRHRIARRPFAAGAVLSVVTVASNWVVLEIAGGITWSGDDLLFGAAGAVVVSALAAPVGLALGRCLAAEPRRETASVAARVATAMLVLFAVLALPSGALAHEVGGDRGSGMIEWRPAVVVAGEQVNLQVHDLQLADGARPQNVTVEAWRAEHRIDVPLLVGFGGEGFSGTFTPPEEGPWMLLIRVDAGDEALLATQQVEVRAAGAADSEGAAHRERFTFGLDMLAANDPPAWLDAVAYGVSLVLLALLVRGLVVSLRRMGPPRETRGPAPSL